MARKMSEARDRQLDRKAGIKQGSARDNALDRQRGVPVRKGAGNAPFGGKKAPPFGGGQPKKTRRSPF
jgi:hypothetical protein